jgi:hypothetical protein
MLRRLPLLLALLLVLGLPYSTVFSQVPVPTSAPSQNDNFVRSDRLGITFISSGDHPASEQRYRQALRLGAGWNRWPMYWSWVERSPGVYDWAPYDWVVTADLQHGLQINAILLGRNAAYTDGDGIARLDDPIFSDGTDEPGEGKTINPNHPWANFVYQAVNRYKPGGVLAQQHGWQPGQGIRVWEAWNEPDINLFWVGTVEEYARLLKVTYITVHVADPGAQVMVGGLSYGDPAKQDWLARVLAVYQSDPLRQAHNWFMDIVAVHNYTYAWRSGWVVRDVREKLAAHGLTRPIWLNETGVPVWDDYPGPTWTGNDPSQHRLRATAQQAAAFLIQSAAYAWAEGAQVVMFHQLYDDCGNQPAGTDFPPNDGVLCENGGACWGDAHGLYRNERDSICFTQHPLPGTPRPAASAYYLLARIFGAGPFQHPIVQDLGSAGVVISFDRPTTGQRIYVMWNRRFEDGELQLPASGFSGQLFSALDQDWQVTPEDGLYELTLPAATRDHYPFTRAGEQSGIGGPPLILVEQMDDIAAPVDQLNPALVPLDIPQAPLTLTPGSVTAPTARPTTDPAVDTAAPSTSMLALPVVSPPVFTVAWSAQDNSGIESYLVWVRVDGGDWQPWLETTATSAQYTGASGSTYEFAVWAVDLAGNWSSNIELEPQAVTHVE